MSSPQHASVLSAFSAAKSRLSPKPRALSADQSRAVLHKSPYAQSSMTQSKGSSYQNHTALSASRYQQNLQNASKVYLGVANKESGGSSNKPAPLRNMLTPRKSKRKASHVKSNHSSPPGTPMSAGSRAAAPSGGLLAGDSSATSQSHELIATIPNLFNRKLSLKVIQKNCLPIEHACCVHSKYMWIASKTKIAIFDCLTLRPVHQITNRDTKDSITCIQLFNKHVWTGHKSGKISVWNADTRLKVNDLNGFHTKRVNEMIQVGNTVWTVSNDATVRVWDMNTMQHIGPLPQPVLRSSSPTPTAYTSLVLVPNTSSVWFADDAANLYVFSIKESRYAHTLSTNFGKILRLKFTNHHVWSASVQGMIQVWNCETTQTAKYFHCHKKAIPCMEVTDSQVWTSSLDKSMHTYDAKELRVIKNLKSKNRALWVGGMTLADNSRIWTLCSDNHIRIWSMYGNPKRPNLGDGSSGGQVNAKDVLALMENVVLTGEVRESILVPPLTADEEKESATDSISTLTDASSQQQSSRPQIDGGAPRDNKSTGTASDSASTKPSKTVRRSQDGSKADAASMHAPKDELQIASTPKEPKINGTTSAAPRPASSLSPHEPSQKSKPDKPKVRQASKESLLSSGSIPPASQTQPNKTSSRQPTTQLKKQASQNSSASKTASTLSIADIISNGDNFKRRPLSPILKESNHELKLDDQAYKTPVRTRDEDIESFDALERAMSHPVEDLTKSLPTSLAGAERDEMNLLRSSGSSHAALLMEPFGPGDESDDSFDTGDNNSITAYEKEVMTLRQQLQDASNRTNRYKERLRDRRSKLEEKQKQLLRLNDKYNQSQTELFVQKERTIELEQRVASLERKTYLDEEYSNRLLKLIPETIRDECKDIESIVWNVEKIIKTGEHKQNGGSNGDGGEGGGMSVEASLRLRKDLEKSEKDLEMLVSLVDQQREEYTQLVIELQKKEAQLQSLKQLVSQGGDGGVKMETLTDALMCYSVALRTLQHKESNGAAHGSDENASGERIAREIAVEE
eukprot:CAMPEP_0117444204 /NCGR_PEP_ID=MMETSP0759-20121206/5112_1 /TAXON_ID=63605 /ORGANISM="Percolomonas cosmopolitus, Strain WS" /LENGTH=1026 /DNA_ID=CAMNT_0005236247 /DNA_START=346 /DNA_END=3426 /DNA_ORIENTATION=+